MSYDRIWLCPQLDPRTWAEYFSFEKFSVRVNAGGPCLIDELYLFLTVEDAIAFYEHGVDDPEFVSEDGLACGFDKISLRVCGQEIAVRSKPVRNMCEGEHA